MLCKLAHTVAGLGIGEPKTLTLSSTFLRCQVARKWQSMIWDIPAFTISPITFTNNIWDNLLKSSSKNCEVWSLNEKEEDFISRTWVVHRATASRRLYWFLLSDVHCPPSILHYKIIACQTQIRLSVGTKHLYIINYVLTQQQRNYNHQDASSGQCLHCSRTQFPYILYN